MAREQFHVVPDSENDEWKLEKKGSSDKVASYDTKHEAVETGRAVAHGNEPSQMIVHKKDGKFESESTYKDDPFPPAG